MRIERVGDSAATVLKGSSGWQALVSYETPVVVVEDGAVYVTTKKFSRTTSKHIGQFLRKLGLATISCSQDELEVRFELVCGQV